MPRLLILVALALTACAHGLIGALPRIDAPDQAAEVVVIRPRGFVGCAISLPITFDGSEVYGISCGEHARLVVPAGERIFGVKHWSWFVAMRTPRLSRSPPAEILLAARRVRVWRACVEPDHARDRRAAHEGDDTGGGEVMALGVAARFCAGPPPAA
jgi:hypothetical protein